MGQILAKMQKLININAWLNEAEQFENETESE